MGFLPLRCKWQSARTVLRTRGVPVLDGPPQRILQAQVVTEPRERSALRKRAVMSERHENSSERYCPSPLACSRFRCCRTIRTPQ